MLEILWADLIAYMILQTVIVNRSWGASRIVAALPLAIMMPMLVLTVVFPGHEANPWLLGLLLLSPPALLYVVLAGFFVLGKRPQFTAPLIRSTPLS